MHCVKCGSRVENVPEYLHSSTGWICKACSAVPMSGQVVRVSHKGIATDWEFSGGKTLAARRVWVGSSEAA